MNLNSEFQTLNETWFDAFLEVPVLRWNSRLRSSAGRFIPGHRRYFRESPPVIEVASYLLEEKNGESLVRDTIAHEMIHYWLWVRRQPYGHTADFYSKMKQMGCSRYNPVPRLKPVKYFYQCPSCSREFPARRRLGALACANCCKQHAHGRYDVRFKLVMMGPKP